MVRERPQRLDNGIAASYKDSKIIAKTGNAHSIGESLILPAVSIIISDVMKLVPEETVQAIPLSNSTVCMRIDEMAGILKDEDLLAYVSHLKQVIEDMKERFCDLLNLDIPGWILDPFGVPAVEVHPEIQEELIELQSDVIACHAFGQFGRGFWMKCDLPNKFPTLWGKIEQFLIAFPSTYLVECAFSKVVSLTKSRNRMDAAARGDLRLSLTRLEPDIMKQRYTLNGCISSNKAFFMLCRLCRYASYADLYE
uniref:HAT C-terminal dimerisation domain-containing protein n=1 Tax=Trichuris muris TaxID=70415 RepID=A0A5S6R5T6_TRIMR